MDETLASQLSRRLIEDLQRGTYPQGTRLPPERELMARYGVGRNTLREAVRGLVTLGLLDVRAGIGTTVRFVDGQPALERTVSGALLADPAVEELVEFRLLLETRAAEKAAARAAPADVAQVRQALAAYEDAVRLGRQIYERDVAFHRAVAAASHNSVFVAVIDTTAQLLLGAMREADREPGDLLAAATEHALIANRIAVGDQEGAAAAMREHILHADERRQLRGGAGDGRPPARGGSLDTSDNRLQTVATRASSLEPIARKDAAERSDPYPRHPHT